MQNDCFPDAVAEWPKASIGRLADVNPRYRVKKGRSYPFVEMAAVGENFGGILSLDRRMLEGSGLSRFRVGDTLFAKITPCPENGKVAFVSYLPDDVGLGSTEFIVLSPRPGTDPRFLYHLACSHAVRGRAAARMEGSTGRQRVPDEAFTRRLLVPIPDSSEQAAIARILDVVDRALERTHAAFERARELRGSILADLLSHGVSKNGKVRWCDGTRPADFVITPLGRLPSDWRLSTVASEFDLQNGFTINAERRARVKRRESSLSAAHEGCRSSSVRMPVAEFRLRAALLECTVRNQFRSQHDKPAHAQTACRPGSLEA